MLFKGITKLSELNIDADKDWNAKGITNIKQVAALMEKGDMIQKGDNILQRIAAGPDGYVLTSAGPGKLCAWAPAGGALKYYFPISIDSAVASAIVAIAVSHNQVARPSTSYDDQLGDAPAHMILMRAPQVAHSIATVIHAGVDVTHNENTRVRCGVEIPVDGFVEERHYDTGSHDAADHATVMTDSVRALGHWVNNELVGATIYNITDGSSGVITANTDHTVTVAALVGGADNTWQAGDTYMVRFDKTAQARSTAAGDCKLPPMSPLQTDRIYIGSNYIFPQIWINHSQVGAGNWTNIAYYWNGAWVACVDEAGDTDFQTATGFRMVQHTPQGDWALSTIMGMNLYWMKIECTNFINQATAPLATQMFEAIHIE